MGEGRVPVGRRDPVGRKFIGGRRVLCGRRVNEIRILGGKGSDSSRVEGIKKDESSGRNKGS
jgi:hypothetical protein